MLPARALHVRQVPRVVAPLVFVAHVHAQPAHVHAADALAVCQQEQRQRHVGLAAQLCGVDATPRLEHALDGDAQRRLFSQHHRHVPDGVLQGPRHPRHRSHHLLERQQGLDARHLGAQVDAVHLDVPTVAVGVGAVEDVHVQEEVEEPVHLDFVLLLLEEERRRARGDGVIHGALRRHDARVVEPRGEPRGAHETLPVLLLVLLNLESVVAGGSPARDRMEQTWIDIPAGGEGEMLLQRGQADRIRVPTATQHHLLPTHPQRLRPRRRNGRPQRSHLGVAAYALRDVVDELEDVAVSHQHVAVCRHLPQPAVREGGAALRASIELQGAATIAVELWDTEVTDRLCAWNVQPRRPVRLGDGKQCLGGVVLCDVLGMRGRSVA